MRHYTTAVQQNKQAHGGVRNTSWCRPRGAARVVCHGSGNGWYEYASNGVVPFPDRTLVLRRADGTAAKVRFVRYELGEPLPSGVRPRYVTLEVAALPAE